MGAVALRCLANILLAVCGAGGKVGGDTDTAPRDAADGVDPSPERAATLRVQSVQNPSCVMRGAYPAAVSEHDDRRGGGTVIRSIVQPGSGVLDKVLTRAVRLCGQGRDGIVIAEKIPAKDTVQHLKAVGNAGEDDDAKGDGRPIASVKKGLNATQQDHPGGQPDEVDGNGSDEARKTWNHETQKAKACDHGRRQQEGLADIHDPEFWDFAVRALVGKNIEADDEEDHRVGCAERTSGQNQRRGGVSARRRSRAFDRSGRMELLSVRHGLKSGIRHIFEIGQMRLTWSRGPVPKA